MKLIKKYWWFILLFVVLLLLGGYRIFQAKKTKSTMSKKIETTQVELVDISSGLDSSIESMCSVEAVTGAAVIPELGGKVVKIRSKEGVSVKKGQVLFELENIQQRVAVQNARVSLSSAKLALSDLLAKNGSSGSLVTDTQKVQEASVASAKNAYLNAGLKAYSEDIDDQYGAPTISGNYHCEKEGVYTMEVYGSSTKSGASFRFSGLESGVARVTTDSAMSFGSCGLEIIFPKNFRKGITWKIPVPNTRSARHFSAKQTYEQALAGKNLQLAGVKASPQQIAQARARVNQAALQLESAQHNLSKTRVTAPVSGVLTGFNINAGDFVAAFQGQGFVKSVKNLELISYVSAENAQTLVAGAEVFGPEKQNLGTIRLVSPVPDPITKKNKLYITLAKQNSNLIEGTNISCAIQRKIENEIEQSIASQNNIKVPLSSISVVGSDYYIFTLNDGKAHAQKIIPGALLGENIEIHGIKKDTLKTIIRDARGVRDGAMVSIKE